MRYEEFKSKLDSDDVVFVDLRTAHERFARNSAALNGLKNKNPPNRKFCQEEIYYYLSNGQN